MINEINFIASLPPIQSAISLDGNGDGARVKLDIPRSHIQSVLELQKHAGKYLRVLIYVEAPELIEGEEAF